VIVPAVMAMVAPTVMAMMSMTVTAVCPYRGRQCECCRDESALDDPHGVSPEAGSCMPSRFV
jgi:hypothetical protein